MARFLESVYFFFFCISRLITKMEKRNKPICWPFEVQPSSSIPHRYFLSEESVSFGVMVCVSIKESMSMGRKVVAALTVFSKLIFLEKKTSQYLCFLKSHYIRALQTMKSQKLSLLLASLFSHLSKTR